MPTATTTIQRALPGASAPTLQVPLVCGGMFELADERPDLFTMVVFFRGRHCPVCQVQLRELSRRLEELAETGIQVVAISGEHQDRSAELVQEWGLPGLRVGYDLSEEQMRQWGLFISRGITSDEPEMFNEPGLFLVRPDGTIYYAAILSMPVGRPRLDDLLAGIEWWSNAEYPARGGA